MRPIWIAAAIAVLVLVVAGCGGSKKAEKGESERKKATIAGLAANDHGSKQVSGKTEVELDNYYFDPTVLKGKPGSKVTLELKNDSSIEHNFSIDAQHIDKDLEGARARPSPSRSRSQARSPSTASTTRAGAWPAP